MPDSCDWGSDGSLAVQMPGRLVDDGRSVHLTVRYYNVPDVEAL